MDLNERIEALSQWGKGIEKGSPELEEAINQSAVRNKWFTKSNIAFALDSIVQNFLDERLLSNWVSGYAVPDRPPDPKTVGLVMAGNIPLVGFHDLLCVLITGHKAQIKLSSKDEYLLPALLNMLFTAAPGFKNYIDLTSRLHGFDAVVATGSNNAARYFEYYFGSYPHIIRKNRHSEAVLTGKETDQEIVELGKDLFQYFGLGCRNVSKLYVPASFDFARLLNGLEPYAEVMENEGYKHNYDYNRTLLLMNREGHHANDFLMIKNDTRSSSPIACIYYEEYALLDQLQEKVRQEKDHIQCIVSNTDLGIKTVPFGHSQTPSLSDYADNIDTIVFLLKL